MAHSHILPKEEEVSNIIADFTAGVLSPDCMGGELEGFDIAIVKLVDKYITLNLQQASCTSTDLPPSQKTSQTSEGQ